MVGIAAVVALLFGASVGRLSPLPPGLALPPETVQQQLPFRRATPTATNPHIVDVKTLSIEPGAAPNAAPIEELVSDQPPEETPASFRKSTMNHTRSVYEDEANVVAQNTVVRYEAGSPTSGLPQKKP